MKSERYSKLLASLIIGLILFSLVISPALAVTGDTTRIPIASDGMQSTNEFRGLSTFTSSDSSPVMFIENAGQFDSSASFDGSAARFQVRGGDHTIWLAEDAIWFTVLERPQTASSQPVVTSTPAPSGRTYKPAPREGVNVRLDFVGANLHPRLEPFNRLDTHISYFVGNDPTKWHADVPVWGGVRYKDLYPGIDLEISGETGHLVQSLVSRDGAHLEAVRLRVEGVDRILLDGDLLRLATAVGEYTLPLLQLSGGNSVKPSSPAITGNQVASPFGNPQGKAATVNPLAGASDLLYSTFLGGVGYDYGNANAVDSSGAAFVTGQTTSSNFPTTPGVFDASYNANNDAFVVKLNAAGSALTYATFLGGSSNDIGSGIVVDSSDAVYVTGQTTSSDFPTTAGAFDTSFGGGSYSDAFIVKLNAAGSALIYATFLGGSSNDSGYSAAVDSSGAVYVTGNTSSSNFPTTVSAYDTSLNGGSDVFVSKLNSSGSSLIFSTFLGGNSDDCPTTSCAIAVDATGAAYVTGRTNSSNFPTTAGAFDTTFNGGSADAFVTKINPGGDALGYSTFLGSAGSDYGYGITVDGNGFAYVTGVTWSTGFPTTPGAFKTTFVGASAYVTKLDATGTGLIYSTFLGDGSQGFSIAIDASGAAYVVGQVFSSSFPTTSDAYDPTYNGYGDAFITKLNSSGTGAMYSTFLGAGGVDCEIGGDSRECFVAIDTSGAIYIAGGTTSSAFPTSAGAYDTTYSGGAYDAFVSKLVIGSVPLTYSISGRVTDASNNPISSVTISDGAGHSAATDNNGYYALGGLPVGSYTITPSTSGYTFSPPSRNVILSTNVTGQNFTGTLAMACYTLTTNVQPNPSGTITRSPAGNCNNGAGYLAGTSVIVTAVPSSGYTFIKWDGTWGPSSKTRTLTINSARTVTANFAQQVPGQQPVVVLVRGWGGTRFNGEKDKCDVGALKVTDVNNLPAGAAYFGSFAKNLVEDGRDVWIAHLDTGGGTTPIIEVNAECLRKQILDIRTQTGVNQVVLIGHSMGGLVSRAYIENPVPGYYGGDVSKLITLGTPHTGTSDIACLLGPADDAGCQFGSAGIDYFNQRYSSRAPNVAYSLIGGYKTPGLFGEFLLARFGPNDGAVGVDSALGWKYRGLLPPIEVIGGASRYGFFASHANFKPLGIPDMSWYPSYFDVLPLLSLRTEAYNCIGQILGISSSGCPASVSLDPQARTSSALPVSQVPQFSGHLPVSQTISVSLPIDTVGKSELDLVWITGTVGFTLENPLGTIVDPTYAAAHPTELRYAENTADPMSQFFASYTFTTTVPGMYTLNIVAGDVDASGTDYRAFGFVESPRLITVTTNGDLYAIGSTAIITASLQNENAGLTGATVQAKFHRVGVITDTVTLTDQGGGIYTGTYIIPNAPGYLGLSVVAQGNDAGTAYARQEDSVISISPSTMQLSGQYADNPLDSDSNGKFDTLNLAIGVMSTQSGNYILSGDLLGIGNRHAAHGVVSTTLTTGVITVTLPFNGDDIRRSGLNGPYTLTNLTIADQQNSGVPAVWKAANVYTTALYNSTEFAATCFVLAANTTAGGTISTNPAPNCNGGLQYTSGTTVTLTAIANAGHAFTQWSGGVNSQAKTITLTLNADTDVAAHFITSTTGVTLSGATSGLANVPHAFTATVNPVTATQPITYIWQATAQPSMTTTSGLSSTAVFTWTTPGIQSITVTATNEGSAVTGTHTITVTGPLASIAVTPDPVTVTVGMTQTFTAAGADGLGNLVSISPTWSSDAGLMAGNILTAQTTPASSKYVTATVEGVSGTAIINVVAGPLATIMVTPNSVTVTVGTTQTFSTLGRDAFGNAVPIAPTWTTDAGTMASNVFTAQTTPASDRHVTATVANVSDTAIVNIVAGSLNSVVVTPQPATITVGVTQTFTASGADAFGNSVSISPTWSTDAGAMTGGVLTAQTISASSKHVTATVDNLSDTITFDVTAGPLSHLTITPTVVTLTMRATQQFTAAGFDVYHNVITHPAIIWQAAPIDVGVIDATGWFTAGNKAGIYPNAIVVASGSISTTAKVIVRWPYQVFLPSLLR